MNHYRGELWLILVTLLAASGWFVSKAALQELPAAGFIGARLVGAALLFLPFALPQLRQWTAGQFARAAVVGAAFSGNIFFWIQGVSHSYRGCCFATAHRQCCGCRSPFQAAGCIC